MHNWIMDHGRCVGLLALGALLAAGAGCQIYEPKGGRPLGAGEHRRTVWERVNAPNLAVKPDPSPSVVPATYPPMWDSPPLRPRDYDLKDFPRMRR